MNIYKKYLQKFLPFLCGFSTLITLSACDDSSSNLAAPPNQESLTEEISSSSDFNEFSYSTENSSSSEIIYEEFFSSSSLNTIYSSSDLNEENPIENQESSSSELSALEEYENTWDFIDDGWRDECLKIINDYRATEDLEPLTLADDDKQLCAIEQAANDMADNVAHGHFGDCGESAQNSGPNFTTTWPTHSSATATVQYFAKMMWEDEKALSESGVTEYAKIGHYLNMKGSYHKVACGIALSSDGSTGWFNMNFYY